MRKGTRVRALVANVGGLPVARGDEGIVLESGSARSRVVWTTHCHSGTPQPAALEVEGWCADAHLGVADESLPHPTELVAAALAVIAIVAAIMLCGDLVVASMGERPAPRDTFHASGAP